MIIMMKREQEELADKRGRRENEKKYFLHSSLRALRTLREITKTEKGGLRCPQKWQEKLKS